MPHQKIISAFLLTLIFSNYAKTQSDRFQFGMEPFYYYAIYNNDKLFDPHQQLNLFGLGFYSEYGLTNHNDRWVLMSGLYYFQIHSSHVHFTWVDTGCNNNIFTPREGKLEITDKYISHNLRIPILFKYKIHKLFIQGGFLIDIELTNIQKTKIKLDADEVCNNDPQLIEFMNGVGYKVKKNNSLLCIGSEVGIGYNLHFLDASIALVIKYNFQVGYEYPSVTSEKYSRSYHALGLGIKLYF